MSIKLVETAIRDFLSSPEPDVLCLSGRWGVGKTYAWDRYFKAARAEQKIALKRYAYVSLFGIDSLAELKYSIFENAVQTKAGGNEPSLETLRSNAMAVGEQLGRRGVRFLQQAPRVKEYLSGLGPVWFMSVKETIVCIDDIERRGKNLPIRDVLGLVSTLKEQKKCKVALILNDDALEEDHKEFAKYYEKVVDTSLKSAPSPEESVRIALNDDTGPTKFLAENCIAFRISNIRLIKKIERSVRAVEGMLMPFDEQVLKQAIQSLTLFGWSIYEPSTSPPIDYLTKRGTDFLNADDDDAVSENEAAWNALLDASGFTGIDDFDLALLDGLRNGFFDPASIRKHGSELSEKIKAGKLDKSFSDSWERYHDSFDNNQDAVLDAMYQAFLKGAQHISPLNMNSTVALFKALGREPQAAEIINHYVQMHSAEQGIFDLQNYSFAGGVTDPDVVKAFNNKYASFSNVKSPRDILLAMAKMNGWNPEDITTLSTVPVNEYCKIFKQTHGKELRKVINACLQFDRIGNATAEMKEISQRAKDALKLIGEESPINARRVKAYGVAVDPKTPKK